MEFEKILAIIKEKFYDKINWKKVWNRIFIFLLMPLGAFLYHLSSLSPEYTEKIYSTGVNRFVINFLSFGTSIFKRSVGEILIFLLIVLIFAYLGIIIYRIVKNKKDWVFFIIDYLTWLACVSVIIYFLFIFLWGINYNRLPLSQSTKLDTKPSSAHELEEVCMNLAAEANVLRTRLTEDENGVFTINGGYEKVFDKTYTGYKNASARFSVLAMEDRRPKPVKLSKLMSYAGITGIYFPFTAEANVNVDINDLYMPVTACHELAHMRGFAREDEANFIGFLACIYHTDDEFKYSGYALALTNCMNSLYGADRDAYMRVYSTYSAGLKADYAAENEFWKKKEGNLEKISTKINDTYLKVNNQQDGVKSYGRMVDLVLAYYRWQNENKK